MGTFLILLALAIATALGLLAHWALGRLLGRLAQRLAPNRGQAVVPASGSVVRVSGEKRSVTVWVGQGRKDGASS